MGFLLIFHKLIFGFLIFSHFPLHHELEPELFLVLFELLLLGLQLVSLPLHLQPLPLRLQLLPVLETRSTE